MILTKDAILSADDRQTREVDVPEWGGSVIVKALSGEERDAFEASLTVRRPAMYGPNKGQLETVPDPTNVHSKLVARAIVDEAGVRVFTDSDIVALGQKSAAALQRVWDVAAELSGLNESAVEDAEGNSESAPAAPSTSDSPAISD